jgi:type II secretory pathway pseudopilin PulG
MRRNLWVAGIAIAIVAGVAAVVVPRLEQRREQQRFALFTKYCTDCHNAADLAGGVSFEHVTPESVPQHGAQFEAAIVKLRGRLMPPPGNPQPSKDEVDGLITGLERTLDENAPPQIGYVTAQRLDRTEYAHAVKALLDVDIDPKEYLPAVRRSIRERRGRRRAPRRR